LHNPAANEASSILSGIGAALYAFADITQLDAEEPQEREKEKESESEKETQTGKKGDEDQEKESDQPESAEKLREREARYRREELRMLLGAFEVVAFHNFPQHFMETISILLEGSKASSIPPVTWSLVSRLPIVYLPREIFLGLLEWLQKYFWELRITSKQPLYSNWGRAYLPYYLGFIDVLMQSPYVYPPQTPSPYGYGTMFSSGEVCFAWSGM